MNMMIWALFILLTAVLVLIFWLLFIPIVIEIDTSTSTYSLYQPVTFSAAFMLGHPWITFRVFGLKIDTRKGSRENVEIKERERDKKTGAKGPSPATWRLINRCLKSIRLKKFILNVDTGDPVLNSKIVPIFYWINASHPAIDYSINYMGNVYARLNAEVRLYLIGMAFIKYSLKH